MKHRLFLIIATLVGLGSITTSCSWDDELVVANNDGDQKTPISFNVNIGSLPDPEVTTRSNDPLGANVTKATRGYSNPASDGRYYFRATDVLSIGICGDGNTASRDAGETNEIVKQYTVAAGDASNPSKKSLTYAKDADGNTTYKFDWLDTNEKISLRAWSWGNADTPAGFNDACNFVLDQSQNVDLTDNDKNIKEFLYSPALRYEFGDITIPLYHQLSRIVVNVKSTLNTATDESTIAINSLAIGSSNIPTSATFLRPSGDTYEKAWTYTQASTETTGYNDTDDNKMANLYGSWGSQTGSGTVTAKKWDTATTGYTATFSAVIIPYDGSQSTPTYYKAGHKFIVISTSNGTYYYNIPTTDKNDNPINGLNFQPGKQYTFNITDLNQIDFNVTVSEWGAENSETLTFSN